jgi:hypothetical protein
VVIHIHHGHLRFILQNELGWLRDGLPLPDRGEAPLFPESSDFLFEIAFFPINRRPLEPRRS